MKYVSLLVVLCGLASAESFPVTLQRTLWRDAKGTVEIDAQGIRYADADQSHRLEWGWLDIQYFDRVSRKEFVVLTYADDWKMLGRDREYRFVLLDGELGDSLFAMIGEHLKRPVTDRVAPSGVSGGYRVPVKHLHTFGGCLGELVFTRDWIYYVSKNVEDGRSWRLDRDVVSVFSDDPYRLEIRTYDDNRREMSRTATYRFDLREKLDAGFYRALKLRLYELEEDGEVIGRR